MSWWEDIADAIFDPIVEVVSAVFEPIVETVSPYVDAGFEWMQENPVAAVAAIAAAIYTAGGSLVAEGAVAAEGAVEAGSIAATSVADAGAYSAAADGAFGVADYAAVSYPWESYVPMQSTIAEWNAVSNAGAIVPVDTMIANAAAGNYVAPMADYSLTALAGSTPSTGFLAGLYEAGKVTKNIVDTVQLVNQATRQKTVVPANSPIPAGWAIDGNWNTSALGAGSKFQYDPATGAVIVQTPTQPGQVVQPASVVQDNSGSFPVVGLIAGLGILLFLGKSK